MLHDKITKEESRCFDYGVRVQSGFLCKDCNRQREVEERFGSEIRCASSTGSRRRAVKKERERGEGA